MVNDPVNLVDSDGLFPVVLIPIIKAAITGGSVVASVLRVTTAVGVAKEFVDFFFSKKCPNDTLTPEQTRNLKRFKKRLPKGALETNIRNLTDGGKVFSAEVPGEVPGSRAIYEKQVNNLGQTVGFEKTTIDPQGNIVHVKDKFKP